MIDFETPRFTSSQVAKAAGIDINTFRSNFKRGHFRMVGQTDAPAERHGVPHMFGLRDALGYAVTSELIASGIAPRAAWEIGLVKFAHTGSAERLPARLFDVRTHGLTVLLYRLKSRSAEIIPIPINTSGSDLDDRLFPTGPETSEATIVMVVDYVYFRALDQLDPAAGAAMRRAG